MVLEMGDCPVAQKPATLEYTAQLQKQERPCLKVEGKNQLPAVAPHARYSIHIATHIQIKINSEVLSDAATIFQ